MLFGTLQALLTLTSVLATPSQDAFNPGRYKITNVHFRGDARILNISETVIAGPYGDSPPGQDLWNVHRVPGGFTIENVGLKKFATSTSDVEGSAITSFGGENPETFSISTAGFNQFMISVPAQDLVWAGTDLRCIKCNPELTGYVTLQPADGSAAQRWTFEKK